MVLVLALQVLKMSRLLRKWDEEDVRISEKQDNIVGVKVWGNKEVWK